MKILKRAEQHNVILNKDYYIPSEINEMLSARQVFYLTKDFKECYEELQSWELQEKELRIFTEDLKEIKVKLDDYGYYKNVAVDHNGKEYYVSL